MLRAASCFLLLAGATLCAQSKLPTGPLSTLSFPIDSIMIEGNHLHSAKAIIEASGLEVGGNGSGPIFDAARERLIASGYFDTVAYRYKPAQSDKDKPGYDVTYEVQEIAAMYPIRIDGLPTTAGEANKLLQETDPLFTGKMPGTKEVLKRSAELIDKYLAPKGYAGGVAGKVIAPQPEQFVVDFTPARGLPAVSTVAFAGSRLIPAVELHNRIAGIAFGQPFTEEGFRALLESQIVPLYEVKGYMRVTFPKIATQPSSQVTGVDVTVTIDEGTEYKLTRVAVAGKTPEESARILAAARIPKMTVANFGQVEQAAKRVQESMRKQGFLDALVTADKKIDDAKKTVAFFLVVDGGPKYTFGRLTVNGLGLEGEAAIRKMWGVKPGDGYPEGYGDYFLSKVKEEGIFDNLGDTKADPKVYRDKHVVDVTLDFKGGAQKKERRQGPGQFPGQRPY